MDDRLHAIIGRQQVELETLLQEYTVLLGVLQQVAAGTIAANRVTVDLTARTWAVAAPETATHNA